MGSHVAPLVDGELVAQRKDLELEAGPRSEASANSCEDGEEDLLHGGRQATRPRRRDKRYGSASLTPRGTIVISAASTFRDAQARLDSMRDTAP